MKKDFSTDSITSRPNSFISCMECRTQIHFDYSIVSKSSKKILLEKDRNHLSVPNWQRYRTPSLCNKIRSDYNSSKQLAQHLSGEEN